MNILSYFTNSGVPETGLSPTIRIRNVSTGALVVTDDSMTEVGDGFYNYDFTGYDATIDYSIRSDGGVSLADAERYSYAGNESYFDDVQEATWSASVSAYEGKNVMGAMTTILYENSITIDIVDGMAGTSFPAGTHRFPVNNIPDALTIATARGLHMLHLHSDVTIGANDDISGYSVETVGLMGTTVTLTAGCSAHNSVFRNINLQGTLLNGDTLLLNDCSVGTLDNFTGIMNVVAFMQGAEISFGPWAQLIDCLAGGSAGNEPEFTLNTSDISIHKYTGNIKFMGKTGANTTVADFVGGNVVIDASCVAGKIQLLGMGQLEADNSGAGCQVDTDGFITTAFIADGVWDESTADHTTDGTFGGELATKADILASTNTVTSVPVTGSIVFGTNDGGSFSSVIIRDGTYWIIEEDASTGITVDFTFNLPSVEHRAGVFSVFGRYEGLPSTTHYLELWAYNYESTAWEQMIESFMPGGITSDELFTHEYHERNIDRDNNNEVQMRIKHNVTTYNATHHLYLDFVDISSIEIITAEDIADAVWSKTLSGGRSAEYVLLDTNESMKRALGLMHENIFIDQPGYDTNSNLVSARVRIYSDSASVGTGNNVIGTYQITSQGTGRGQFANWAQVKV